MNCENEVNAVHVLLLFLKLYKNFNTRSHSLKKQGIDGVIEIPFTPTIPKIPQDLLDAFNKAFEQTGIARLIK